MRIDHLKVYPLRYATEETRQMLLERREMFRALSQPQLISYEGANYSRDYTYPTESRFMLDYHVYAKFHALSEAFKFSTKQKSPYDGWPDLVPITSELSDKQVMLLPPGIHGFFLKEKNWGTSHSLLIMFNASLWLIFKPTILSSLRKIERTSVQIHKKTRQDDIIVGKGNGLIMLLHGGPGTGKTLTTVLLLDEADVFLEERSLSDLERNSLVSVFLRTLEYYEGMLFLTSNRVGTFDEAFKSRIQLALHYRPLDGPSRRKIWQNFLHIMRENNKTEDDAYGEGDDSEQVSAVDFDDIAAHMDELAAYEMNGRQIRNSLATARQLAVYERETLDWDRIKDAIEVASDFNNYIKEVYGHTDEQWSRDNKFR
ncbi:hypothetical protein PpBr36_05390 [Pyricularia pennisetigena]|uniref:hypothetical protein n=1 Tax=Pyricularia pennisetigena TaxID=1578925 RepID=UPI00114F961F|nr:hypothetical protein PpBr36_05390 [Pyricularia pennisetigena]TLS27550.1 hypothetical protein PpBr36_05390 [Pyricularia pennisetigena]